MRREKPFWQQFLVLAVLLAATFSALFVCESRVKAVAAQQAAAQKANLAKHVLILSIDGFHQNDLADPAIQPLIPNILALQKAGVTYTNAFTPIPSDSFPGLLGILTGASPKTTGVYYDVSYSRTLFPPGTTLQNGLLSNPSGTQVNWDETLDFDNTLLNGGNDSTPNSINPANLPLISSNGNLVLFWPHNYLQVNDIFEVAHAAGFRTAWADKHPAYEIVKGPSGQGVDDLYTPEIEAGAAIQNGVLVTAAVAPAIKTDPTLATAYDDLKLAAVLNQIQGKTSTGATVPGNVVPGIFGMNFLAVSSMQKLLGAAGGIDLANGVETVNPPLVAAYQHTDASIGKIVTALKAANLYNNTMIVLTAKHGQGSRVGTSATIADVYSAIPEVAQEDNDDIVNLWLADQTQSQKVLTQLQGFQNTAANQINTIFAGSALAGAGVQSLPASGFGDPSNPNDDRAPDFIVRLNPNNLIGNPAKPKKRAEHGGFTDDDRHVSLIVSGGIPSGIQNTVQNGLVKTLQIAPTALEYLGLNPLSLQGAAIENTPDLPGLLNTVPFNGVPFFTSAATAFPSSQLIATAVTFKADAFSPVGLPLTFVWNFGDPGSGAANTTTTSAGNESNVTHTFATAGFYTATVTVEDGANFPIVSTVNITVTTPVPPTTSPTLNSSITNVIVIYQENWSFDGLYSQFPGANGLAFGKPIPQIDVFNGNAPMTQLLAPINNNVKPEVLDTSFAAFNQIPALYDMTKYIAPTTVTGDIIHRFLTEQAQIDGGKMDKFVTLSDNPGLVLGCFDATNMPEGKLAQQYTMCDNFFHGAFGGSFLNHQWLISAQAPLFPNAPASIMNSPTGNLVNGNDGFDANGNPTPVKTALGRSSNTDNAVSTDGYAVNTLFTVNTPHPSSVNGSPNLVPNLTNVTIGDRMNDAGVSWKWYSGGWDNALAGNPDPLFQFHHQPFAFYANYADGTALKKEHLQDETKFFTDLTNNTLPNVSFIKPLGPDNEHPGYTSVAQGQLHVAKIVAAVQNSAYWKNSIIIVTYDEHGGRFDHVAPPSATSVPAAPAGTFDRFGPGVRVPAIIISPFAKKGFVDHTAYDTTSILKFIEKRWSLAPMSTRDAAVNSFDNALNFTQPPVIGTAASAIPNPASVGQTVTFNVGVNSPASLPLTITWNFGDAAKSTATGASVTFKYTTAGSFSATVSISDGLNPPVTATVPVVVKAPKFGTGVSSDGSGVSDAIEALIGNTFFGPAGTVAPDPIPAPTLAKVQVKLTFASNDTVKFGGTLPVPASLAGQVVFVDFGGEYRKFTLDASGRQSGDNSISFSKPKGGTSKYVVSLKKANLTASFGALGVKDASFAGKTLAVPINIFFNKAVFSHQANLTAKKAGKSGLMLSGN